MPVSLRHRFGQITIAAWLALVLVAGSYLLGAHLLTLPEPDVEDARFQQAVAAVPPGDTGWHVVHFLFASCPCSRGVFDHLTEEPRPAGVHERLVLIDDPSGDWAADAREAGFEVESISADELAERYGVEAAPLMVVVDPDGVPQFVGGYTDRKRGPVYHDVDVIEALLAGSAPNDLPLFGCAVSRQLRQTVDPLALR